MRIFNRLKFDARSLGPRDRPQGDLHKPGFFTDYALLYVILVLLMAAALLVWQAYTEISEFHAAQHQLAQTSVRGAAAEIETLLAERRRAVTLFVEEQVELLQIVVNNPENEGHYAKLDGKLRMYFPELFAFTVTDSEGQPYFEKTPKLIDVGCRADIRRFIANEHTQQVYIHPNFKGYHYDLMVPLPPSEKGQAGVFFISFQPTALARVLANSEIRGHHLMLILKERLGGLVEVSAQGARDQLIRPKFLSREENARMEFFAPVESTLWTLVDIPEQGLFTSNALREWLQSFVLFLVFACVSAFMLYFIKRAERRRKQAEDLLRESNERFQDLYDNSPAIYFSITEDGKVTGVNQYGADSLGFTKQELIGHPVWGLIHKQDLLQVQQHIKQFLSTRGVNDELEFRKIRKDGSVLWVRERFQRVEASGAPAELRILCQDVTALRQAQERIRRHELELAHFDRLAIVGELASSLAHELNQPLGAAVNYAQAGLRMVEKGVTDQSRLFDVFEQTVAETRRAGAIIHSIRDFIGKDSRPSECIEPNALITNTLEFIKSDLSDKQVNVHVSPLRIKVQFRGDRIQLEQVLLNLIFNGIEAMQQSKANPLKLILEATSNGDKIRISVTDTGPGISSEVATRLFEPFVSTKTQGMGMGLAISRSIIEAHAGRLWVETGVKSGARFHMTLPIDRTCGDADT